ncbi:hypothetical protein B0H12DRAFT_1146168 [Mycena haematopus]|nr:hypothetical protein B0H12DRAFT_1146168 [Mycena haematopus]
MSTQSLLERTRRRKERRLNENDTQFSSPSSTPGLQTIPLPPTASGSLGLDSSPNPFSNGSSFNVFPPSTRSSLGVTTQLKNFGERTLQRIKLSDESEAEFKRYIEMASKDERDALHFVHTLQLKDMVNKSTEERSENWTASTKLAKTIRKFIYAVLLLPNIQYYCGTVESTVISAMRASGVKELPDVDSLECDQLTSFVAREFSLARYAIKKMIQNSVDETKGTETRHIAALAEELLKHALNVKPMLGLWYRLALIRSHIALNHSTAEFWDQVDKQLEELHHQPPNEYVDALETVYEEDLKAFGDPAKRTFKPGDHVNASSPKWLQNLSALAPKVQRVVKKKGNKRKRHVVEPEDDEDNTEQVPEEPETQASEDE